MANFCNDHPISAPEILQILSSNITLPAGAENVTVTVTSLNKLGSVYVKVTCQQSNRTGTYPYIMVF